MLLLGKYIRSIFKWWGIRRDLQKLLNRKKRQELFRIDVEKETERILKEIGSKER